MSVSTELLRQWMQARDEHTKAAAAEKSAKERRDTLEVEIHDAMTASGDKSLSRDIGSPYGVVSFVPNETIFGDVYDEELFLAYINERAQTEEFSKPAFRKKQINEEVRRRIKTGQELPPGVEFRTTRYVTATRKR